MLRKGETEMFEMKLKYQRSSKNWHIYNPEGETVPMYFPVSQFPGQPPKELTIVVNASITQLQAA